MDQLLENEKKRDLDWVMDELITTMNAKGYQKMILVFDKGRIVHAVRETPLKPPSFFKAGKK